MELDIKDIKPDPNQPRKTFDEESLTELASSIRELGVIQPIAVRKKGPEWVIVAGERRFRAAKIAGLEKIPVHVLENRTDVEVMESALIENVQRQDLNAVEEGMAYKKLIEEMGSADKVSKRVGKSRSLITNAVRVLTLPDFCLEALAKGELSRAHAIILLQVSDPDLIKHVCDRVIKHDMTTRQLSGYLSDIGAVKTPGKQENDGKVFSPPPPVAKIDRSNEFIQTVLCPECFHEFEVSK